MRNHFRPIADGSKLVADGQRIQLYSRNEQQCRKEITECIKDKTKGSQLRNDVYEKVK